MAFILLLPVAWLPIAVNSTDLFLRLGVSYHIHIRRVM